MDILSNNISAECMNSIDIRIGLNGYLKADSKWKSTDMSIPFSKLYYVTEGEGYLLQGEDRLMLTPGKVYLVPYGVTHSFGCDGYMEKLYFHLTVTQQNGCDLFENCGKILVLEMDTKDIHRLKRLYFSDKTDDMLMLKSELYKTVNGFYALVTSKDTQVYSRTVNAAVRYIHSNLSIGLSINGISEALFISESKLSKIFAKETGTSIGKYIDRAVMTKAQQLLIRTDKPVRMISEELGFCDQFYFSRKFKQYYCITPLQYRRRHSRI